MCVVPLGLAATNATLHAQLRLLGALLLPTAAATTGLADAAATRQAQWFSPQRLPQIMLGNAPRQENDYDCGLFMLRFIEQLSTKQLPSFESVDALIESFGRSLSRCTQKDITEFRSKLHDCLTTLAEHAEDVHQ